MFSRRSKKHQDTDNHMNGHRNGDDSKHDQHDQFDATNPPQKRPPSFIIRRHVSEPIQRSRSHHVLQNAAHNLANAIKNASSADLTYVIPQPSPHSTTTDDVDPVRTFRSNPLWRVLSTLLLFAGVAFAIACKPRFNEVENEYVLPHAIQDLRESIYSTVTSILQSAENRPGLLAKRDGLQAHYPIVFIPGIVSTGLEVWQGEDCAASSFRQRFYGSTNMIRSIILDVKCWLRHMSLDNVTGLDPPGMNALHDNNTHYIVLYIHTSSALPFTRYSTLTHHLSYEH
jgi:hypothetical protein